MRPQVCGFRASRLLCAVDAGRRGIGRGPAPQKWHLDALHKLPVAAVLLRGKRATEFHSGPYSDFASGVSERQLEAWAAPLRQLRVRTWDSTSLEEWSHFVHHLDSAQLVTGEEANGERNCDWRELPVAPTPPAASVVPGSAALFWANKVHRGPGTDSGEERLVLFCSWVPRSAPAAQHQNVSESVTDYSFYDCHLEPKLRLDESARATRARRGRLQ